MPAPVQPLPPDRRLWQGAALFLASLFMFFISSIFLYLLYAHWRRETLTATSLPFSFLTSTVCLLGISLLVHRGTRQVRQDRRYATATSLGLSAALALVFMVIQGLGMYEMLESSEMRASLSRSVGSMVVILAVLHALHVVGGVVALAVVAVRSFEGRYDHERHGAVDFAAAYWHFLDLVWLLMLLAFWGTTDGFGPLT